MISVAMATFNGDTYIQEQLDSIYNQTRKVDEIIIVDDCSTDSTVRVIEQYIFCLLYTSPSPRDPKTSRMPSSA